MWKNFTFIFSRKSYLVFVYNLYKFKKKKKKPLGRLVFLSDKQLFFIFKDNGFSKLHSLFPNKKGYSQVKDGDDTWRSTIGQSLTDFTLKAYNYETLSGSSHSHSDSASVFFIISILRQADADLC
ncbi:unnamed protein product, partial [Vitis vinifera]